MAYKLVTVWVEGTTPMLQHRATEEALRGDGQTRINAPGAELNPRDICEKAVYRLPDGGLGIPGAAFARMLREAGGAHKAKGSRKSLKYLVPAALLVLDDICPIYLKDRKTKLKNFEVDARPVTIPATKGRVMRYRARFPEWAVPVNIRVNETLLDESMVRQLMREGLEQVGLGDFRPEKGGPFGTASIVAWDVQNKTPLTNAQRFAGDLPAVAAK